MNADYLKIARRNLVRNKFNSIINLAGLTLGVTCFLIILSKVNFETSFDRFHSDSDRIYRVVRVTKGLVYLEGALEYRTGVFFPLPRALKEQIPELEAVTKTLYTGGGLVRLHNSGSSIQQAGFREDKGIVFLGPEFFEVLDFNNIDFQWIAGSPQRSLSEPFSVVLTQSLSEKYFGKENPLGRVLEARNFELKVTGVISDFPQNTDFPFQLLISFSTLEESNSNLSTNWGGLSDNFQCYLKIQQGTKPQQIEEKIKKIYSAHAPPDEVENRFFKLQALDEVHSDSRFGNYNDRVMGQSLIFALMSIGILLIIIACINHSNLTVAQMPTRTKVAGICKVLGSNRKRVMAQFFGETFILTTVAMIVSIFSAIAVLENLSGLIGVPLGYERVLNAQNLLLLCGIAVAMSILSGIYPATLISKARPIELIRSKGLKAGKGNLRFGRMTVIFQFIIAQVLIVCTLVVFRQLSFIESKDMGYDRENVMTVEIPDNNATLLDRFRHKLLENPSIATVSFGSVSPGRTGNYTDILRFSDNSQISTVTERKAVDGSYIDTYGLHLLSGRNFSPSESGRPIIVNQKVIRDLQFKDEFQAVGNEVEYLGGPATIIGVVRDFHSNPIYESIRPCVFEFDPGRFYMAGIKFRIDTGGERVHKKFESIISKVEEEWKGTFPGQIFEFEFFDDTIASYYREDKKVASLINIFTGIMIFICCLGIFGLIHHTVSRRSKEIALRKVVGAPAMSIVSLLVRSFTLWVFLANLVAWPIAWWAMDKWLQNFAYRIDVSWWIFALSGGIAMIIAILTVSFQAIRAAVANPVDSLRYE